MSMVRDNLYTSLMYKNSLRISLTFHAIIQTSINLYWFCTPFDVTFPWLIYIEARYCSTLQRKFREVWTSWYLSLHPTNGLPFPHAAAFRRALLSNWHWDILIPQLLIKHQSNRSFCCLYTYTHPPRTHHTLPLFGRRQYHSNVHWCGSGWR